MIVVLRDRSSSSRRAEGEGGGKSELIIAKSGSIGEQEFAAGRAVE
jgi:hypothetical protein